MNCSPLAAKHKPLHLIQLNHFPIYEQLRLEEALLRADSNNWCIINRGTPPSIVIGISGKQELLLNQPLLAEKPVPVIRRFSGGGTVFVDANTFFITWICNSLDSEIKCCPTALHQWTTDFYASIFPHLGIKLLENDYVLGDRKFGGNAQYLSKGRWLHHSSLLWDYHPENMRYLMMPAKVPNYREKRTHDDFLCRLHEHFVDFDAWNQQLLHGLSSNFHIKEIALSEAVAAMDLPHRSTTQLI